MSLISHIAFICDGNGRWAKARGLPRTAGHIAGLYKTQTVVEWCVARKIPNISVFLWSTENWRRESREVRGIMDAVVKYGPAFIARMHRLGVRLIHAGLREGLEDRVLEVVDYGSNLTRENNSANLCLAFNYGGKVDIINAINHAIEEHRQSGAAGELTQESVDRYLMTFPMPEIDLLVRSGNETRISNFMLWQAARADMEIVPSFWPDFAEAELDRLIGEFAARRAAAHAVLDTVPGSRKGSLRTISA